MCVHSAVTVNFSILSLGYSIFSLDLYIFQRMNYMVMFLFWLALKKDPALMKFALLFILMVVSLGMIAVSVELINDQVVWLTSIRYSHNNDYLN